MIPTTSVVLVIVGEYIHRERAELLSHQQPLPAVNYNTIGNCDEVDDGDSSNKMQSAKKRKKKKQKQKKKQCRSLSSSSGNDYLI